MPHSPEVAAALEKSIEHWQKNRAVKYYAEIRAGSGDCALCSLFNTSHMSYSDRCLKCPVMQRTGKPSCENTPYDDVYTTYSLLSYSPYDESRIAAWRELCDREIDFLESLRDPE